MKTKHLLTPFFLAAFTLAARAQLVTSTVSAGARSSNTGVLTKSAPLGPVQDQAALSLDGDSALTRTHTSGLSYITLAPYPGDVFIYTAPFTAHAEVHNSNNDDRTTTAPATLRRDMRTVFAGLTPGRNGTQGTIRARFSYSWDIRLQNDVFAGSNISYVDTVFGFPGSTVDERVKSYSGNGVSQSHSGSEFWTSIALPITFGTPFDLYWYMTVMGTSGNAGLHAIADGSFELWDMDVYDSSGNRLSRRIDYEWYELNSTNAIIGLVAPAAKIGPSISIRRAESGNIEVTFSGILQESPDLNVWADAQPQPAFRFEVSPVFPSIKFYRTRAP